MLTINQTILNRPCWEAKNELLFEAGASHLRTSSDRLFALKGILIIRPDMVDEPVEKSVQPQLIQIAAMW